MTITETLIEFARNPLHPTDRARQIIDLSLVDWAACGLAGADEGTFSRWVRGQAAYGFVPTFHGVDLTAPAAALVNGTLSHALDYDDTHFDHIGHPSVVVLSALMAARPRDWSSLIEAALVGVEASIRIGMWLGRDHYERGFHQTATAGAFGACVGLIRLHGLPDDQARAALGLCATMASGLKAQFGTMGKPLNAGLAARAAVEAAQWALGGMSGPADGVEAFGKAHRAACDPSAFDGLGRDWRLETLSHKFHACCHGLHATLEALRGWDGGVPETVEVSTHPRWMTVCNIATPSTGLEAKFSYAQVVAMTLAGLDTGDIASFSDDVAEREDIAQLRACVTVKADTALTETQARVRITAGASRRELFHDLAERADLRTVSQRIRQKADVLVGPDKGGALWVGMRHRDLDAFRAAALPAERAPDTDAL